MNSGVFVAEPSRKTFDDMLARLDQPGVFWRRTDQTFLQAYFPDWHGLPYIFNTLQYVWFNLPGLWDWNSIHVIHYQYEKPWEPNHPKRNQLAASDRPLVARARTGRVAAEPTFAGGRPCQLATTAARLAAS